MGSRPRAVVTGDAGFLGSHLCERLLVEGYDVVCLDNLETGAAANVAHLSGAHFDLRLVDVTAPLDVPGRVDSVLHFASPASAFVGQALTGRPLTVTGDGSQTRSVIYVDDLVEGIVRMLRSGHPGPVNLGNPHEVSVLDLARTVTRLCGSTSPVTFVPRPEDDPHVRRPDIALAREVLGWEPAVGFEDGLARTIAWFRTHPRFAADQDVGPGRTLVTRS